MYLLRYILEEELFLNLGSKPLQFFNGTGFYTMFLLGMWVCLSVCGLSEAEIPH